MQQSWNAVWGIAKHDNKITGNIIIIKRKTFYILINIFYKKYCAVAFLLFSDADCGGWNGSRISKIQTQSYFKYLRIQCCWISGLCWYWPWLNKITTFRSQVRSPIKTWHFSNNFLTHQRNVPILELSNRLNFEKLDHNLKYQLKLGKFRGLEYFFVMSWTKIRK